jgi:hypothetical protein
MADNSSVPVASGNETFANDDIGGVKYPRPKINWGPDGTANDVDVASGKPLPVQVRSATGLVPIGEPTDDKSTATDTTSVSLISLVKQLSAYLATLAGAVGSSKVATKAASGDFADGAIATLGAKADDKSTATDTTAISLMQVAKQISASVQAAATSLAAAIPAGTNLIGKVSASHETSTLYNGTTALTPKFAKISCSSSGNNEIVAAVTGKKIRVISWDVSPSDAVNFKWRTASTDITGLYYAVNAGNGVSKPWNPLGYFETVSDEALNLNLSGAIAVGGSLVYVEV